MSLPSVLRRPVLASSRPPLNSSVFLPSNSTTAPAGGGAPIDGPLRAFFSSLSSLPSSVLSISTPLDTEPLQAFWPSGGNLRVAENSSAFWARYLRAPSAGEKTAASPLSLPARRIFDVPSQPSPGRPPG